MTRKKLRILHLTRLVGRRSFGVGPVALGLASGQQAMGGHVEIWCQDPDEEIGDIADAYSLSPESLRRFPHVGPERLGFSPAMKREIVARAQDFDIIHQHGFWTAITWVTNCWQEIGDGKTVITPHGTLDSWALRKSTWKKRLSLRLYGWKNLSRAGCLHALSPREAESIRQFGIDKPIAVIPNGIPQGWLHTRGESQRFLKIVGLQDDAKIMLFLGRITPIKGLPMLIQALHKTRASLGNWRLVIAGVDEFGHEKEVRTLVEQMEMQRFVYFAGPLYGQNKRDAFAASQLFVLPSHSEGAPIVIPEALGAGVPVLATKASPWEDLHAYRCGWGVDISVDGIASALEQIIHLPPEELREMGQRGKALATSHYTWSSLAKKTLQLYAWLIDPTTESPDIIFGGKQRNDQ